MTLECLALLDSPQVRQIVATWPRVTGKTDEERFESWANASGAHQRFLRHWLPILLTNQIIYADGRIDEIASEYIATVALSIAQVKGKKRK